MGVEKTEWWKNFFTGVALDLWRAAVTDEQTRVEADFIQKALQLSAGVRILDVPCGNGRLSIELASRGYQVSGIDIAPDFITEARNEAAERQLTVQFEQADMRDLPWSEAFDGAFCFGNSFGYLDDEGNAAFLEAIASALKPGAKFIVDATIAESFLPKFHVYERFWVQAGNILLLIRNSYDHVQGRINTEYTFVREGHVEKRPGSQRIYTYHELCRLLEGAGFSSCQGYGSLDQEPFKLGSEKLFIVATKK